MSPALPAYLDHNSTTPIRPEVLDAMLPFLREHFANPNSVHGPGQKVRHAVEEARERVARLLGAKDPSEVVFTSCGSEANVFAVQGALEAARARSSRAGEAASVSHAVTSAVEHDSIRELFARLEARGFSVSVVGVDARGRVRPEEIEGALRPETAVVSIMHANNETGAVQPVEEVARLCRGKGVLFHTDAVQSAGKLPLSVSSSAADLLSLSGHKFNAPKGVGALWVRSGVKLSPLITGHQEKNRRGGTENAASIVALGAAAELAARELGERSASLRALRDRLDEGLQAIPGAHPSVDSGERLPGTCHFCFEGVRGHELVVALDLEGFCASSGPACAAGQTKSSHVLSAMGIPPELAGGALRLSLGWGSTREEVERLLGALPGVVERLRKAAR
ncbi:MAG: cysteine desulfurase family protein [Elusimicrobiota bacterium]